MTINERFFELLGKKRGTQKVFCEVTGIPETTVSGWKARKTDPPASLIASIADYFGVTVRYLLTGEDIIEDGSKDLHDDEQLLLSYYRELSAFNKEDMIVIAEAKHRNEKEKREKSSFSGIKETA